MCVPHLIYPFLCQWTFRLLLCLSYCKQHCYEHWGTCIFQHYGFLWIYGQEHDCSMIVALFLVFQFFKEPLYCSPQRLYQFIFPPTVQEGSLLSIPCPAFIVCGFFGDSRSDWCAVISHCSSEFFGNQQVSCIFPRACLPSVCRLWRNVCLGLLPIF